MCSCACLELEKERVVVTYEEMFGKGNVQLNCILLINVFSGDNNLINTSNTSTLISY